MLIAEASAACQPVSPASGQTVTCTDTQPTGFIAPAAVTGLTVNIQPGATIGSQQTSAGTNPSFTNVRVNGTSVVNNAGTISNTAPLNRDNFGVNLAGDRSTLNNTGTITLTAPAGNTTTRIYGAYSSAPGGSQYESTTVTNSGTIAVTQNGNGIARGIYSGENTTLFTINNTGLISATRGTSATASTAVVAGVDSDDDTDRLVINNAAAGRITATGVNTRAISGRAAQYEINNSGTITNTTAGEAAVATFALNAGTAGDATTVRAYNTVITNTATGVINGDVRNFDQDLQTATTVVNLRRTGTLTNAGAINGNVAFGGGNQTVTNIGRISGGLSFLDVAATVNTVTLGTGSSIGGNITARGLGTNTLNLTGTGTLTGTVAGFTSLNQTGTGSAWTTASGSVQTLSGNLTVAGGNLTLGAGSTQNVGGLIQVTGSGAQLTVNNTLTNKTVNLSGSNTSLVNNGTLTGTGAAGRANTAATRVYGVLTNSTGADFANVSVTNNGTIAVTENGIGISRGVYAGENIASMTITNAGTISATRTGTGTAAVAAIDSDDDVAALTVTNRAGATISGTGTGVRAIQGRAQSYTINNAGTITGPAGGQAIVVYGAGNGFLNNAATGVITGDVRFTDSDPQVATTANRRNSTTTNAGRIVGNIQYGMGNQTLTNTGAITGNITYADVAASRNTVNLGTGSTIGGNISASGLGINALNLSGTGTLTSNVTGFTTLRESDGAWTLAAGSTQNFSGGATVAGGVLTVNSTLNANTAVAAAGTLAGTGRIAGTLTNAGIVAPGSITAPYGALTVAGNYVQQASGTLQSAVTADGQAARLVTTGTATLDGTATLIAAAGTYLPNTRYTVLTAAGGVSGNFATVTDSGTLPFLIRPTASTDANNAYVTLAQQSFGLVAQTANQASVARGLDAALANNPQALLVIDNQSNAGIAATLDRVAGQGYASLADPQLRSGRAFGSQLLSRAYAASTEAGPTGFVLPPTVYAADMPNRPPVPAPRFVETSRGYGLWATGYGQFGKVDSTANAAGRSETVAGMAAGIDFHPQVGTVLGIAAGYGSVDVSLNRTGERAHTDNAQIGIYGGVSSGALYANATIGYAHTEGRVNRSLGLPQIQAGGAQGNVSGDQFISAGELGYRFAVAPATVLSPFVGFQVNTFDQDGVRESSAGPLSLTIAAKDFLSARTLVGGRLETATTALAGRPVSFWVKAAYVHDFADVSRTIGASFTLVPTVPFAISGRRLARDRALVGLGVSTELAPGLSGFLGYDAELASSDTIQAVRGGVRYTF
ncbi:autotransporter domain-containing protein [Methylobacterium sp. BTF04]|uniref:autotransporter outer membrane beta-barrel domain-containing protein n=1 Tax=Methylobacterium sp. BTF04 TaxID=2708300 RepID=UPI0013D5063B|nr:autotransporter domain-containing protein [Methylobacterium sp. BTF04]NEU12745.1 autotransporter domain-containing protein [Methylobacterium sp. BTF04]